MLDLRRCIPKSGSKPSCVRKPLRECPKRGADPVVRPSQRREMARKGVAKHGISIRMACLVYGISETCYRYQAKLDGENALVADWLLKLTQNHKR